MNIILNYDEPNQTLCLCFYDDRERAEKDTRMLLSNSNLAIKRSSATITTTKNENENDTDEDVDDEAPILRIFFLIFIFLCNLNINREFIYSGLSVASSSSSCLCSFVVVPVSPSSSSLSFSSILFLRFRCVVTAVFRYCQMRHRHLNVKNMKTKNNGVDGYSHQAFGKQINKIKKTLYIKQERKQASSYWRLCNQ